MRSSDPSIDCDLRLEQLSSIPKVGDFLLVETNDMAGMLEETLSVNLY